MTMSMCLLYIMQQLGTEVEVPVRKRPGAKVAAPKEKVKKPRVARPPPAVDAAAIRAEKKLHLIREKKGLPIVEDLQPSLGINTKTLGKTQ